jgi:DnaJ-domain-containing protein 1
MSNLLVKAASETSLWARPITTKLMVQCLLYRDKACIAGELGFVKMVGVEASLVLLTVAALVETVVRFALFLLVNMYTCALLIANRCSEKSIPKFWEHLVLSYLTGIHSIGRAVIALAKNLFSPSKPIFVNDYAKELQEELDNPLPLEAINEALVHFDIQDFSNSEYYEELGVDKDNWLFNLTKDTTAYYVLSDFDLRQTYKWYGKVGVMIFLTSEYAVTIVELKDETKLKEVLAQYHADRPSFRFNFDDFFSGAGGADFDFDGFFASGTGFSGFNFGPDGQKPAECPYTVLGVAKNASESQIKRAYFTLARSAHPDKHPDDSEATAKFQRIQAAYAVLSDAEKRAQYDQSGLVN